MVYKIVLQKIQYVLSILQESWFFIFTAILVYAAYRYSDLSQGYWIVLSALGAQLISINSINKSVLLGVGTAFSVIILTMVVNCIAYHFLVLAICLAGIIFTTIYLGIRYASWWTASWVMNVLVIASVSLSLNQGQLSQRCLCILLGFLIVLLLQRIFSFYCKNNTQKALAKCLTRLCELNQSIFSCLLAKDYVEKKYFYEKELHDKRNQFFYELNAARQSVKNVDKARHHALGLIEKKIDYLYENFSAVSMVLYRVTDHATFDVVHKELYAIVSSISAILTEASHKLLNRDKTIIQDNLLIENIQQLEDVYQSALQVVSPDPKVFLLLIYDLRALIDALNELMKNVTLMNIKKQDG